MAKITTQEEVEALLKQIQDLQAQLAGETAAREKAQSDAKTLASSQNVSMLQSGITEVPTGKTVKVKRAKRLVVARTLDDGRQILKPEFEDVSLPTYFYKIDLPPSGGISVRINHTDYFHGGTYELDIDLLRTVKDIVHRSWAHEALLKGSDENVYRKQSDRSISTGRVVNLA